MSELRWLRIVLCAMGAFVSGFVTIIGVVSVYAMIEGFKAMGQPDQSLINAFAQKWAPIVGLVAGALFSFLFALLAARKQSNRFMHGLMTGVVYGAAALVLGLLGGVSPNDFVGPLLIVLAGAAAGKLSARKES